MRIPAVVRALAVLLTALLAVPFLPPLVGGAEPGASAPAVVPATGDYYLVDLPAEGATGLRDAGLAVVEAYESFALVRDPRGLAASLRETGTVLVPADDLFTITLNGITFDVRQGGPILPEEDRKSTRLNSSHGY